jgi:short-chain fatty acids transporter
VQRGLDRIAALPKTQVQAAIVCFLTAGIQPFWLLPVLAIAKLSVRDVMGFIVVLFLVGLVVFGLSNLLIPAVG